MVNRSMGRDDLYPFVLPTVVLDKMRFIHTMIDEMAFHTSPRRATPAPPWRPSPTAWK
jgi:hypothetical protein